MVWYGHLHQLLGDSPQAREGVPIRLRQKFEADEQILLDRGKNEKGARGYRKTHAMLLTFIVSHMASSLTIMTILPQIK